MKIKVTSKGKKVISLLLPLSSITWKWVIKKLIAKQDLINQLGLSIGEIKRMLRGTIKELRNYKGLVVVDVQNNDSSVLITL